MSSLSDVDERRRQFMLYSLSTAAFAALSGCVAGGIGDRNGSEIPTELRSGRSIFKFSGDVRVNGQSVTLETKINLGDSIETFEKSYVIFVINKDAVILRANSKMTIPLPDATASAVPSVFDLYKGKALTVLASRQTQITTPSAVISIRGTGVYLEVDPERSYVCTCYGSVNLATLDDPLLNETIVATHHDAPRYILNDKSASKRIQTAPFKNHDDEELLLIETLVGRTTPFVVPRKVTRSRNRYF